MVKYQTFTQMLDDLIQYPDSERIVLGSKADKILMTTMFSIPEIEAIFVAESDDTDFMDRGVVESIPGADVLNYNQLIKHYKITHQDVFTHITSTTFDYKGSMTVKTPTIEFELFRRLNQRKIKDPFFPMQPKYLYYLIRLGPDYEKLSKLFETATYLNKKRNHSQLIKTVLGEDKLSGMLVDGKILKLQELLGENFDVCLDDITSFGKDIYDIQRATGIYHTFALNNQQEHAKEFLSAFTGPELGLLDSYFQRNFLFFPELFIQVKNIPFEKGVDYAIEFSQALVDINHIVDKFAKQYLTNIVLTSDSEPLQLRRQAGFAKALIASVQDSNKPIKEAVDFVYNTDVKSMGKYGNLVYSQQSVKIKREILSHVMTINVNYPFERMDVYTSYGCEGSPLFDDTGFY